jgi:transposase
MAFIRKVKTASGATAVQIVRKQYGRIIKIDHIGSAHNDEELQLLITLARQRLQGSQRSLFDTPDMELSIGLKQSFSGLLLEVLIEQYNHLGFDQLADEDFAYLCVARIVEPTSKLDSLRVLADLGVDGLSKDRLYRCLKQVIDKDYRTTIAKLCFARAAAHGISLVLYDVTTLYFEVQKEDDYRKPGMSKERRLEPQIIVGLLVDQHGFPLSLTSFEGNMAETNTILPVMEKFRIQHGLKDITVVADAGMLSTKNLQALAAAGYRYIVGSRLHKIPYDIAEYQKTKELADNQIITTQLDGQRIIYQYRAKRAALDLRNIKKQIEKAEKIVNGTMATKKTKFLTIATKNKRLNQVLIDKAHALVGIKGYVTNLDIPDEQIITYYHQLWNVEASFRMAKSDLRARPVFHRKRDSIEAHLTMVLASLAIGRTIESLTGLSIKQFVKTLRSIRTGAVIVNGKEYPAKAIVPPSVVPLLQKLRAGH